MKRSRKLSDKDAVRRALVGEARRLLGRPYKYGAWWQHAPREFDCSSFVQYLYKTVGIAIPRVSIDQAREGRRILPVARLLKIGDLIFLRGHQGRYDRHFPRGIGHVVIVTGPDEVIHARSRKVRGRERGKVVTGRLSSVLARDDVAVVKRII